MAETDLDQVEGRIERLVERYEQTRVENRDLRQRQNESERLNAELHRRLTNVLERVEKLEQE